GPRTPGEDARRGSRWIVAARDMKLVLWLYPRSWRARYQPEVEALLRCTRLTPAVVRDLVRGAIDARLHPQWTLRRRRRDPNLVQHFALAAAVVAGGLVTAMAVWHSPSRVGTAAGTVTGLGLLAAIW